MKSEEQEKLISTFIFILWDVGNFKPGLAFVPLSAVEQTANDLTVAST